MIESSKDNILQRRTKDSKERIIETAKSLKEHMDILKVTMAACSAILGCNLILLKNDDFQACLEDMKNILGSKLF